MAGTNGDGSRSFATGFATISFAVLCLTPMKRSLPYRLLLASGLTTLCVVCPLPRAAGQAAVRLDSPDSIASHLEPPVDSRISFAPLMSGMPDARLEPSRRTTSAMAAPPNGVPVHRFDASHAPDSAGHGSRGTHILIGALAGGVAGGVAKFAFPAKCTGSAEVPCALGDPIELAVDVGIGVLVGGVIGALLPAGP